MVETKKSLPARTQLLIGAIRSYFVMRLAQYRAMAPAKVVA
jgi:hypothetical protein